MRKKIDEILPLAYSFPENVYSTFRCILQLYRRNMLQANYVVVREVNLLWKTNHGNL